MFLFDNVLTAGTVLVRQQIESQNYTPSGGTSGWAILANGDSFFNNASIRGDLVVGTAPASWLSANNNGGFGHIDFHTGDARETTPGKIYAYVDSGIWPVLGISAPEFTGFGEAILGLTSPHTAVERARAVFNSSGGNIDIVNGTNGDFYLGGNIFLDAGILGGIVQVSQSGTDALSTQLSRNQIMALNGGAASPLYLNWSVAGIVNIGTGGLSVNGNVDGNSATLSSFTISAGVISNAAGTTLGTNINLPGGQVNCTNPPSGAGPGAGTAWWNNVSGTNYRLSRTTSSRRYKENIRELDGYSEEQLLSLIPRWYQRNDNRDYTLEDEPLIPVTESTPWVPGFIAEEAHELGLKSWVAYDEESRPDSFSYGEFAAVAHQYLLRAQAARIATLEARLEKLERLINGILETGTLPRNP